VISQENYTSGCRLCIPFSIPFFWTPPNHRNPARNSYLFLQKGTPMEFLQGQTISVVPVLCRKVIPVQNICRNSIPEGIPRNPAGMHNIDYTQGSQERKQSRVLKGVKSDDPNDATIELVTTRFVLLGPKPLNRGHTLWSIFCLVRGLIGFCNKGNFPIVNSLRPMGAYAPTYFLTYVKS
jgi:hypothetical protein